MCPGASLGMPRTRLCLSASWVLPQPLERDALRGEASPANATRQLLGFEKHWGILHLFPFKNTTEIPQKWSETVKEQIPRTLLLTSECSQESEKCPEFYQNTDFSCLFWFFFPFIFFPSHPNCITSSPLAP